MQNYWKTQTNIGELVTVTILTLTPKFSGLSSTVCGDNTIILYPNLNPKYSV